MTERVLHAPESSRFYDRNATVIMEVPCSSKEGMRKPTVADAKKNGWRPSVTEIIKSIDKAGLNVWKMEHLMNTVIANPLPEGGNVDEWKLHVYELAKQYGALAAERGKEIHKGVERFFREDTESPDVAIERAYREIEAHYRAQSPECIFLAEHSFSSDLGYAGTIDLMVLDKDKTLVVMVDLKTKELHKFKKPMQSDGLQLGAYSAATKGEPFIDTIATDRGSGECQFYRWGEKWKRTQSQSPEELRKSFLLLFDFWCLWNYDPRSA